MARWLQYIELDAEIKSDAVKLPDEAILKYYVKVMAQTAEPQPECNNQSKRDQRLSIEK